MSARSSVQPGYLTKYYRQRGEWATLRLCSSFSLESIGLRRCPRNPPGPSAFRHKQFQVLSRRMLVLLVDADFRTIRLPVPRVPRALSGAVRTVSLFHIHTWERDISAYQHRGGLACAGCAHKRIQQGRVCRPHRTHTLTETHEALRPNAYPVVRTTLYTIRGHLRLAKGRHVKTHTRA